MPKAAPDWRRTPDRAPRWRSPRRWPRQALQLELEAVARAQTDDGGQVLGDDVGFADRLKLALGQWVGGKRGVLAIISATQQRAERLEFISIEIGHSVIAKGAIAPGDGVVAVPGWLRGKHRLRLLERSHGLPLHFPVGRDNRQRRQRLQLRSGGLNVWSAAEASPPSCSAPHRSLIFSWSWAGPRQ